MWPGPQRVAGVGIGLRRQLWPELQSTDRQVDWLEFITENHLENGGWRAKMLAGAAERWPLVAHGVSASVGGPDDFDPQFVRRLSRVLRDANTEYYSDHLCWTGANGYEFHDLLPLPFSKVAAEWAAARARKLSAALELPLVLENITYYAEMPGGELSEGEFITTVLEQSDAYLLLDVNNVYQNAVNHGREPIDVLEALPLHRARQIHLAGFEPDEEGVLLDNHGSAVDNAVWDLYRETIARVGDVPTLIEWDNNIPELDVVLDQADRARAIRAEVLGEAAQ